MTHQNQTKYLTVYMCWTEICLPSLNYIMRLKFIHKNCMNHLFVESISHSTTNISYQLIFLICTPITKIGSLLRKGHISIYGFFIIIHPFSFEWHILLKINIYCIATIILSQLNMHCIANGIVQSMQISYIKCYTRQ